MNDRLREAFVEHELVKARAGVIDHALDIALLEGKSLDEHMIDVLRSAGKLPAELEQDTRELRSA